MAGWTDAQYDYKVGPKGGTLTSLLTYAERIWIPEEGVTGKVGSNVRVPGRGGTLPVEFKAYDEGTLTVKVVLRYTNAAGAVTHTDGSAGHMYENKAAVDALFDGQFGLITLERTAPAWGTVRIDGEVITAVRPQETPWIMAYVLNCPRPTWKSTTGESSSSSPLTIGGSARIEDASIDFSAGASNPVFTHTLSGATVSYIGTVPAGGVRVFPYEGRAEQISGGADESANIAFNRDYGLILVPGSNAFTISSGTATVNWADQYKAG